MPVSVRSLTRGLQIVQALWEDRDELPPAEISRRIGLNLSTTIRLLATLEQEGFVTRHPSGRYGPGAKLILGVAKRMDFLGLISVSKPLMEDLRDTTGETVVLVARAGDERVIVAVIESKQVIRASLPTGDTRPLLGTAAGFALLADATPDEREVIRARMAGRVPENIIDRQAFDRDFVQLEQQGYVMRPSTNRGETFAIAVPVRNHLGQIVAALSIAGPISRWNYDSVPGVLPGILAVAARISAGVGYEKQ